MTTPNLTEPLKVGAFAKIRNSGYGRVRIAEFRGPLGPNGARVYRVLVQKKPRPVYIEVCEDQLEVIEGVVATAGTTACQVKLSGSSVALHVVPRLNAV